MIVKKPINLSVAEHFKSYSVAMLLHNIISSQERCKRDPEFLSNMIAGGHVIKPATPEEELHMVMSSGRYDKFLAPCDPVQWTMELQILEKCGIIKYISKTERKHIFTIDKNNEYYQKWYGLTKNDPSNLIIYPRKVIAKHCRSWDVAIIVELLHHCKKIVDRDAELLSLNKKSPLFYNAPGYYVVNSVFLDTHLLTFLQFKAENIVKKWLINDLKIVTLVTKENFMLEYHSNFLKNLGYELRSKKLDKVKSKKRRWICGRLKTVND